MPTFFTFDGIRICLYFNDHNPPHFHAIYAEHEVLISISSKLILEGDLPKKQLNKVINFAELNEPILLEIWLELNNE